MVRQVWVRAALEEELDKIEVTRLRCDAEHSIVTVRISTIHIGTICKRVLDCVDIAVCGRPIRDLVEGHRPGVGLDRLLPSTPTRSIIHKIDFCHKSKLWPTVGALRRSSCSRNQPDPTPLIHAEPLSDTFVNTNEAQNPGGAIMFEGMIIMGLYIIALVNLDKINGT